VEHGTTSRSVLSVTSASVVSGSVAPVLRTKLRSAALILLACGFAVSPAGAAMPGTGCTDSWVSTAGGAWSTPGNWSSGVPTSASKACITLVPKLMIVPSLVNGWSFSGCSADGEDAASLVYNSAADTDPTETTVTSSAPQVTGPCGSSPCPSAPYGTPVTYTATLAAQYAGSPAPTGSVTFFSNNVPIGMGAITTTDGVSTANLTTDATAATPPDATSIQIGALYTDDSASLASDATPLQEGVEPSSPTVTVSGGTPNPSSFGQPVTLTATVSRTVGAPAPTGIVVFFAGPDSTPIGGARHDKRRHDDGDLGYDGADGQ
jgi:hypothetical protein